MTGNKAEDGILIYDEVAFMRHRISALFLDYHIKIYEASYDMEIYNILSDDAANIRLILMDLGADVNNGFDIIGKIKDRNPNIPIFILTANNKKETFLRGISEGISDYILKPFDDEILVDKVLAILKEHTQEAIEPTQFVFDIQNYLNIELKKANKGKYNLTLLMCSLFDLHEGSNSELDRKHIQAVDGFFQAVRKDLWDTDIFERYGSQTFVGIFPYCGSADAEKIVAKLKDSFESSKSDYKNISSLQLAITTITYPVEITDPKELLISLGKLLDIKIDEMKKTINE